MRGHLDDEVDEKAKLQHPIPHADFPVLNLDELRRLKSDRLVDEVQEFVFCGACHDYSL